MARFLGYERLWAHMVRLNGRERMMACVVFVYCALACACMSMVLVCLVCSCVCSFIVCRWRVLVYCSFVFACVYFAYISCVLVFVFVLFEFSVSYVGVSRLCSSRLLVLYGVV